MLLAFINPSVPTREPQGLSVLVSDIVLVSAAQHTLEATQSAWARRLREIQRRLVRIRARHREN